MRPSITVSLHDVAPATFRESRRWLSEVERRNITASLLVIPGPWRGRRLGDDAGFVEWLHDCRRAGHEIVQHGWEHIAVKDDSAPGSRFERLRARIRARGCGEFASLGPDTARQRLEWGRSTLREHGFEPTGFVPPGWLARPSTDAVLSELGFQYTTTQWTVKDLAMGRVLSVPSTSQRPGSALTGAAAALNVRLWRHWAKSGRPIRMALHPDDLGDSRIVASAHRMLTDATAYGYRSLTYSDLVSRDQAATPIGAP